MIICIAPLGIFNEEKERSQVPCTHVHCCYELNLYCIMKQTTLSFRKTLQIQCISSVHSESVSAVQSSMPWKEPLSTIEMLLWTNWYFSITLPYLLSTVPDYINFGKPGERELSASDNNGSLPQYKVVKKPGPKRNNYKLQPWFPHSKDESDTRGHSWVQIVSMVEFWCFLANKIGTNPKRKVDQFCTKYL